MTTRRYQPALLAAVAVVAVAAAAFHPLLFGGRVLFERDIQALLWGQCESFSRAVKGGAWPVWDAWAGFGQPMLANPGAQVLYPPTWLNLLVRPEDYCTWYALGHLVFAGLGMLWLARVLRLSWAAGCAAGAVLMLSGPLLSAVDLWQHFAAAAWMPWVVAACLGAVRERTARAVVVWSAVQAGQVFTGSLDVVLLTAVPQAGIVALECLRGRAGRAAHAARAVRVVGLTAAAAALTIALTAVQWLPALHLYRTSARSQPAEGSPTLWSLAPIVAIQAVMPLVPENLALRGDVRQYLYDGREPLLSSVYLGLPAVLLALAGACSPRRRLANGAAALWLASLLLALGRHTVLYFSLLTAVPQLALLRYPAKAALLAAFAFALLVAAGFDAWRHGLLSQRAQLVCGALVLVTAAAELVALSWLGAHASRFLDARAAAPEAAVASTLWRPEVAATVALLVGGLAVISSRHGHWRVAGLITAVAVAELLYTNGTLNPSVPRDFVTAVPAAVSRLRAEAPVRLYSFDYLLTPIGTGAVLPDEVVAPTSPLWPWRQLLESRYYPGQPARWGLRGSYEFDVVGLNSPQRRSLRALSVAAQGNGPALLRMLQLGAVSHVAALHTAGLETLQPLAVFATAPAGHVSLFRVPGALPRLSFATGVHVADGVAAYRTLLDPGYDAHETVVLPAGADRPPAEAARALVEVLDDRADRLRVSVVTARPGTLVDVDGFDPGWTATVDGAPAPVLRANADFRAVAVPAGEHDVRLTYVPPGLFAGVLTSLLAAATALAIAFRAGGRA